MKTQEEMIKEGLASVFANINRPRGICLPQCDLTVTEQVVVSKLCPRCIKHTPLYGTAQQFHDYHCKRGLVQEIFPEFTIDEAETISTGICGPCWDILFSDGDDNDD
jgi:hypothetical protein